MAKKRSQKGKTKAIKEPKDISTKINFAWKNLALFLVLFLFSGVFYGLSSSDLFVNFFGILSIVFGFLSLAFLIVFIVLMIVKSGKK